MELPNRSSLEAQFTRRMADLSKQQRARLESLMGDPPDMANVPASFWDQVERENEEKLMAILLLIFVASARNHGSSMDGAQTLGKLWVANQARLVAKQYTQTTAEMAEVLGRDIEAKQAAVENGGEGVTSGWLTNRLNSMFGEARAGRLAVNETTIAQTEGGEAAIKDTVGISDDDVWKVNPGLSATGPCPICAPLAGTKRPTWSQQFPSGPPAHPLCVCEIVYANIPEIRPIRRRG